MRLGRAVPVLALSLLVTQLAGFPGAPAAQTPNGAPQSQSGGARGPHGGARTQNGDCVTIDDFARDKVGAFPADWKPRKDEGRRVYSVADENGLRFLRAVSKGLGIQAAREYTWSLDAYPVLAWRWRPREFPRGSDERDSGANDSALAVYMLVPYSWIRGPKALKYIWSERVPVGAHLTSNGSLTQVVVLRSGGPVREEWTEERVNVRDDYRKLFKESKAPKPAGIAVLTDSDDTGTAAAGDYANFRVCR